MKVDMAQRSGRLLDLWAVIYGHQLALPVTEHLAECDCLSFWNWTADEFAWFYYRFRTFRRNF